MSSGWQRRSPPIQPSYGNRQCGVTVVAGNSNAPYYVCEVIEQVTAPGRVDLVPGNPGPTTWFLYAQGGTTYYPLATATAQAYLTSAANANAAALVAVGRLLVTGP